MKFDDGDFLVPFTGNVENIPPKVGIPLRLLLVVAFFICICLTYLLIQSWVSI